MFKLPPLSSYQAYGIYYLYIVIFGILIPGETFAGHPKPKRGQRLQYKINGFRLVVLTIFIYVLLGGMIPQLKSIQLFDATYFVDHFWQTFKVMNIIAVIVSVLLYLKGTLNIKILNQYVDPHTHGNFLLDFWVGRQLNPRIGSYDIKFNAYKVGMIFWLVLNLSFLAKHIQTVGFITNRMMGYQIVTGLYVLDYFWFEEKMLTTWDIISEEFGYMLVFGDYVFIPLAFSIQAHFLVDMADYEYPMIFQNIQVILFLLGYYIFRQANSQKNQFKLFPDAPIWGKKPQTFEGFWGMGRHMNYTGDLIMAFSYCLPCGFSHGIAPYTYFIYLTVLLLHRAYRDDAKCHQKYGDLWKRYCKKVPYVFVPFQFDHVFQAMGKTLYRITNGTQVVSTKKTKQ